MFSSFSNMLPNLLPGQEKDQQTPTTGSINPFDRIMAVKRKLDGVRTPQQQPEAQPEAESPEEEPQEQVKEKQRKRKPLNETFVVVRPPPSVSNHPLNLQLQLIPPAIQPQQQQRSASTSTTASMSSTEGKSYAAAGGVPNVPPISAGLQSRKEAQQDDDELTRGRANRSDLSLFYSSVGSSASVQSFSTVASTSTTAGGTRRIIPLYNLSAHNVLQNTVLDAGTDATVSRFRKRGIDVVGLGVLEPVEVYGNLPLNGAGGYGFEDASDAGHGSNLGHGQGRPRSFLSTSAVSDNSPPSEVSHTRDASPGYLEESATPTPKENAGKKLFGRLFKKKDSPSTTPTGLLSPTVATPRASVTGPTSRGMLSPPPSARERPMSVHSAIVPPTPTTPQGPYLQPPVLGTQATLRSESYPPHGRPTAYVWILRRWTKGGGVLAGLVGAGGVDMARMGVEVRFEWVKGKKRRRVQESSGQEFSPRGGRPVSVYSLADGDNLGVPLGMDGASARSVSPDPARSGSPTKPRSTSPTKPRSQSPTKPRLVRTSSGSDDEDSDPEDSETPWSCTLRILPIEPGDLTSTAPPTGGMKLRLANLIPAPHHPKVIGQFKMPFPLPDIAVQKIELIPRLASDPFGMGSGEGEGEMVMTAEEVKDVVCTTGLWLMVREGFGGLSGKKRKGDGWKIRS